MISNILLTLKLTRSAEFLTWDKVRAHTNLCLQYKSNSVHLYVHAFSTAEFGEWPLKEYHLSPARYIVFPYLPAAMRLCVPSPFSHQAEDTQLLRSSIRHGLRLRLYIGTDRNALC